MPSKLAALSPFNYYFFEAIYRWMIVNDLDPVLIVKKLNTPEEVTETKDIYAQNVQHWAIDPHRIQDGDFTPLGFHCTLNKGTSDEYRVRFMWAEIFGIIIGPEPSIHELNGQPVIYWDTEIDNWNIDYPPLRDPLSWLPQPTLKAYAEVMLSVVQGSSDTSSKETAAKPSRASKKASKTTTKTTKAAKSTKKRVLKSESKPLKK